MAHTVFVDGSTVTANRIVAAWLNDADTVTYVRFGDGTSYTGNLTVPGTTSLTGALTYGGVTLSNSVTGTGSMMLAASPTTTGTLTAAVINASGLVSTGALTVTKAAAGDALTVTAAGSKTAFLYVDASYVYLATGAGGTKEYLAFDATNHLGYYALNGTSVWTATTSGLTIPGTLGVTGDITGSGTNGFKTGADNRGLYFNGSRNAVLGSNAADTVTIAAANANVAVFGAASTSLTGTLGVTLSSTTDSYFWSKGVGNAGGLFLGAAGAQAGQISQASSGASSTTTYIGNQSITTISDARLKDNIVPTTRNALDLLNQWEIVDHTWNDPSDQCENNRNMRGVWTGAIAQQVQPITPWLVNKPLTDVDENGEINTWSVDYGYAVPLLVKAIQELAAEFQSYKNSHP